jgi:apolipoprotein D and lipocalin family protein
MKVLPFISTLGASLLSVACSVKPPANVQVVNHFQLTAYLGTWYEIARLDNRFERGLQQVTATYRLRDDGGISVINRGFNPQTQKWQQSEGKGYFIGSPQDASLKVSFFGPFYGGYNVIALDSEYRYALVCGADSRYLWILSRTPQLDEQNKQSLVKLAKQQGFATEQLLWTSQTGSQQTK